MNNNFIKSILDGVNYLINNAINKAPFDKTCIGIITNEDINNTTYTVVINDSVYRNIQSNIGKLSKGDRVLVLFPQNQTNNMFINGKIKK